MKTKIWILGLTVAATFAACKKDNDTKQDATVVYIAGSERDTINFNERACYWVNGAIRYNNYPAPNINYYAHAIAVSGNDVYTTGYSNPGSQGWSCRVWKNGQHLYALDDTYSYGNAIAVVGTDIYVGGSRKDGTVFGASLYKNENLSAVLGTSASGALVAGGCASGSDIYMVGSVGNDGKLWKNGTEMTLSGTSGVTCKAVAVSGNDVFVAGNAGVRTIRYWKNNSYWDITVPAGREIYATGIAVEGNDIYVCGTENNATVLTAKYWKNGAEVVLGNGIKRSYANGIAVKDGKVYVVGAENNVSMNDFATLWENGVPRVIGAINSEATAIVVK